ncbi:MAG: hypothetical protein JWO91_1422 [Acidobacteriaceae bacterium]|nr:hypothetical protein [Acidobacteriaceae bacterium]
MGVNHNRETPGCQRTGIEYREFLPRANQRVTGLVVCCEHTSVTETTIINVAENWLTLGRFVCSPMMYVILLSRMPADPSSAECRSVADLPG